MARCLFEVRWHSVSHLPSECHTFLIYIPILLPSSFLQFPSELDPWKILQEHVLSDYLNHEVRICILDLKVEQLDW